MPSNLVFEMTAHLLSLPLQEEQSDFLPRLQPVNLVFWFVILCTYHWPAIRIIIDFLTDAKKQLLSCALCDQQLSLLTWDPRPPVCIQIWWLWGGFQGALRPRHLRGSGPSEGWRGGSLPGWAPRGWRGRLVISSSFSVAVCVRTGPCGAAEGSHVLPFSWAQMRKVMRVVHK